MLDEHKRDTPVAPRYDVYLLDGRGWYYRYIHPKKIDKQLEAYVRQFNPHLIAVARPHHLIQAGECVRRSHENPFGRRPC